LPDAVENAEVVTVVLGLFWSLETVTSTPIAARNGKAKKSVPIPRLVSVARKKLPVFFIFSVLARLELQRSELSVFAQGRRSDKQILRTLLKGTSASGLDRRKRKNLRFST
jgi:hypothetical protein